jgi:hypothetical protein
MNISENTALSIARYADLCVELETKGGATKADWEHARSYAVEAMKGLLYDNSDRFDYVARMEKLREDRTRGNRTPSTNS